MVDKISAELIDCNGARMWARTHSGESADHLLIGQHFSKTIHPAIMALPDDAVVLDAGAHIGCYAISLLQHKPNVYIIAMEPEPSNYGMLVKNLNENMITNIHAVQFALDHKRHIIDLHNVGNTGAWSAIQQLTGWDVSIPVRTMTIQDIIDEIPYDHIDLVKLDIEGMEWQVLANLPLDIMDDIKVFDIDIHHAGNDIKTLLESMGFNLHIVLNWKTNVPSGVIAYRDY